jgi:hypothetical protein
VKRSLSRQKSENKVRRKLAKHENTRRKLEKYADRNVRIR